MKGNLVESFHYNFLGPILFVATVVSVTLWWMGKFPKLEIANARVDWPREYSRAQHLHDCVGNSKNNDPPSTERKKEVSP